MPAPGPLDDDRPDGERGAFQDRPGRGRTDHGDQRERRPDDPGDPRERGPDEPGDPRERGRVHATFAAWWRGGAEAGLRAELRTTWDPIGLAGEPTWPADEYDRYLLRLVGVLRGGATPERLAAELGAIERDEMGFASADTDPRVVAAGRAIHAWYAAAAPVGDVRPDGARR